MATGYLVTPNGNSLTLTSTWTSSTNPSTASTYVTFNVPAEMQGATLNSATFTYTNENNNGYGTKEMTIRSTGYNATDKNILNELKKGVTQIEIYFRFTANKSYYPNSTSASAKFKNIKIMVDYTVPGKVSTRATISNCGTCDIYLPKYSTAVGESHKATLVVNPTKAITNIAVTLRVGTDGGHEQTYNFSKSISKGSAGTVSFNVAPAANWFGNTRINNVAFKVTVTSGGTNYSSSYAWIRVPKTSDTYTYYHLLSSRQAPVVDMANSGFLEDGTTHYNTYGGYIQGQTKLKPFFKLIFDTSADPDVTYSSASLTIDGNIYALTTYSSGAYRCEIDPISRAGDIAYTIKATDSFGQTSTTTPTPTYDITVFPYTAPTITGLSLVRYEENPPSSGTYVESDEGEQVWINANIAANTILDPSKSTSDPPTNYNTWTLKCVMDGNTSATKTLLSSRTEQTYTLSQQRFPSSLADLNVTTGVDHVFKVIITDQFRSVTKTFTVSRTSAIFNIEEGGVAVGMRVTNMTASNPGFQVSDSYTTYLNGPTRIANLTKLNGFYPYDTGWVDISSKALTSVITPTSSRFHIRRVGCMVQLRIRFTLVSNLAANTSLTITSAIDSQFRPETTCRFLCTSSETGGMWLDVQADGTLRTYSRGQAVAANGYLSGDVVYMTEWPSP